eukprot:SM000190S04887  [mRNA]  locus=s190:270549:273005:- [translate_table: standard]
MAAAWAPRRRVDWRCRARAPEAPQLASGGAMGAPGAPPPPPVPPAASAGDNEYHGLYLARMAQLRGLGWPPAAGAASGRLLLRFLQLQVVPLRRLYAWGVPTRAALEAIASASPRGVIEPSKELTPAQVGAGTGYWAHLLQQRGVPVVAVDRRPMHRHLVNGHHALPAELHQAALREAGQEAKDRAVCPNVPPFVAVQEGGPATAAAHPDRSLLLCWPPPEEAEGGDEPEPGSKMAVATLRSYSGNTLVYVGETPGHLLRDACPASSSIAPQRSATAGGEFYSELQQGWQLEQRVPLPTWPGAQDSLTIWRRSRRDGNSTSLGLAGDCSTAALASGLGSKDGHSSAWRIDTKDEAHLRHTSAAAAVDGMVFFDLAVVQTLKADNIFMSLLAQHHKLFARVGHLILATMWWQLTPLTILFAC